MQVSQGEGGSALPAEARARVEIDRQLKAAGWAVVDRKDLNLFTPQGSAVREVIMATGHGRADYLLYVDKEVVGVIEAKPEGTPLSGVEWQSAMYATGLPKDARARLVEGRLPYVFEANGSETHFTNGFDPHPRARRFYGFPRPETLARWLRDAEQRPHRADLASEDHRRTTADGGRAPARTDPGRPGHRKVAG